LAFDNDDVHRLSFAESLFKTQERFLQFEGLANSALAKNCWSDQGFSFGTLNAFIDYQGFIVPWRARQLG
jgi:hypothetical protein